MEESVRERRLARYLDSGRQAMDKRDFKAAVAAFEQALRISPDDQYILDKIEEANNHL